MHTEKSHKAYILSWAKWKFLTDKKGDCCNRCGENQIGCLCFHHSDPSKKEAEIKSLRHYRLSSLISEVEKCELVCRRCHDEIHSSFDGYKFRRKQWLLSIAGGSICTNCGYTSDSVGALHFHHRDPSKKSFNLSNIVTNQINMSFENVIAEIEKCDVLCSNCHAALHFDSDRYVQYQDQIEQKIKTYRELPPEYSREQIKSMYESGMSQKQITEELGCSKGTVSYALGDTPRRRKTGIPKIIKCARCDTDITNPRRNQRYCSRECRGKIRRIRPDREVLVELLQSKSQSQIARDYDVSRVAVHKWLKHYNLLPYE